MLQPLHSPPSILLTGKPGQCASLHIEVKQSRAIKGVIRENSLLEICGSITEEFSNRSLLQQQNAPFNFNIFHRIEARKFKKCVEIILAGNTSFLGTVNQKHASKIFDNLVPTVLEEGRGPWERKYLIDKKATIMT